MEPANDIALRMDQSKDHFPILNIQEFSNSSNSNQAILFHELHGERSIAEAHKHSFFIAILFEQGKGSLSIDFIPYNIGKQQLHLVFPEQVHQWKFKKETIGYQLMIAGEAFEAFLPYLRYSAAFYQRHPVIDLPAADYRTLLYEFQQIQKELEQQAPFQELVQLRCDTIGLLISRTAAKVFKDFESNNTNPLLSRFLGLIDQHYKEQRSVAFYANMINISPNYLNMISQKELNVAASSLIQQRVLLEAKRLLKASKMTIKEIVFDLGFYDHANFAKFFKAHTGMTPTAFKDLK
ncbi:helix-turn-helix domain-containing protein [Chitinophaga sp. Hz27]|uniref:helix-turn-helix domain-containing protein n=1 Tax=Chitinophaga sp. Hz27 TaxID=3347169 RepID=UPI0035D57FB9